ncbi:MAG: murein biosynthesis integral membrane protein MurJ [Angustibacter sp.]
MNNRALFRSSGLMAMGTVASRILGFVRASLLTALLGVTASVAADTFTTANTVPTSINGILLAGLLNAVLVPQIVRSTSQADGGRAFLDRLLTIALTGGLLVTLASLFLAPAIPRVFAASGTWDADARALCVAFSLWCLPQVFFYGLYAALGQVLNARGQFGAYTWAPVVNNIVAIVGLILMLSWIGPFDAASGNLHSPADWTSGQIALLAGTATLGIAAQALILLVPLLRSGFRYKPRFDWRGVGLGTAGQVVGWTCGIAVLVQIGFIASSRVINAASAAGGPGQLAYVNGFLLFILPHSIITVSLVTALFTRMSQAAKTNDFPAVRTDLLVGIRITAVSSVLALAGLAAIGPDLTATLFANNKAETDAMAAAAIAMMLGLAPFSVQYVGQRTFYAMSNARTPFLIHLPVVGTTVVLSTLAGELLPPAHVVTGIGAGFSVSYALGAILSIRGLRRRLGDLAGRQILGLYGRLILTIIPAIAAGRLLSWLVHEFLPEGTLASVLALGLGGSAVLACFVAGCWVLRVDELREVLAPLRARGRQRRTG